MKDLIGKKVVFTVSDPWDFADENDGPRVTGIVDAADDTKVLLRADSTFVAERQSFDLLLCALRHEGCTTNSLVNGDELPSNGMGVPSEFVEAAKQLDSTWWRGTGGLVGSIRKP